MQDCHEKQDSVSTEVLKMLSVLRETSGSCDEDVIRPMGPSLGATQQTGNSFKRDVCPKAEASGFEVVEVPQSISVHENIRA